MDEVDVREAHRAAQAGEVLLLDVREDDEWAHGRAPGARHVPMGRIRADTLPRDRPIHAICRMGGRSASITVALAGVGYEVRNVAGGMQAWAAAGLPVVRDGDESGVVI